MNEERVGDIVLHGNDAIRLAYMLYRPTEEELLYNRSVLERIDNNITITERDNGYDAEIKDLDLSFLEEKPQCSLGNIEVTWTVNIQKEEFSTQTVVMKIGRKWWWIHRKHRYMKTQQVME